MRFFLIIIILSTSLFAQVLVTSGELGVEITELKSGAEISSIKKNASELLNENTTSQLFTLTIENSSFKTPLTLNSSEGWNDVTVLKNGSNCSISFTTPTNKTFLQSLKVVVTITTEDKKSEWDISVTGLGESSLHEVIFPQINIKTDGNDYFFLPHYFGQEISNPKSSSINSNLLYPTGWDVSMQFSAYYNNNYGVYLGTHDPKASVKYFTTNIKDGGINYYNKIPIPNKSTSSNSWEMPGVFCLELFEGNWYDASQIYKKWVSSEAEFFPKEDASRSKRQEQLGNISVWGYASSTPTESMNQIEEDFQSFADYFSDINVGIHWYQWNYLDFDNDYPKYFPELAGMTELVTKLQNSKSLFIMPYINGRLFDQDLLDYSTTGFPYATKDITNTIYTQEFNNNTFAVMCPTQEPWQNILVDASQQLTERIGCSGIYLDQVCAANPVECMDTTHNHPLGGGSWWRDGYNKMFEKIHINLSDEKFIIVEGGCDYLLDEVDGFLVEGWTTNNLVPAFPTVYAGKVQLIGRSTSTGNYFDQAYYAKLSQALVFGVQLGRASTWIVHDPNATIAKPFLKKIATIRHKLKEFLSFGKMLRPLTVEKNIPSVTSTWVDYGDENIEVIISALQTSTWENKQKNKIAILFSNASMTTTLEFPFNFTGEKNGFVGDLSVTKITEKNEDAIKTENNSFSKTIKLKPLHVVAYIMKADSTTSILKKNSLVKTFNLEQNYPNPFNPSTEIEFTIPAPANTSLTVYDTLGQEIKTLVNKKLMAGTYSYTFNASNFPSGIYFYKIKSGKFTETKKMLLLK